MPPATDTTALLQIGEVAQRVGLSFRTVRYWDEVGLARPSARSAGGFRLYSQQDVRRLLLLKHMKALGLSLEEMGELAELIEGIGATSDVEDEVLLLESYAARADHAIEKLTRQLQESTMLRRQIRNRLKRVRASPAAADAVRLERL